MPNNYRISEDGKTGIIELNNSDSPVLIDVKDLEVALQYHWYKDCSGYPQANPWNAKQKKKEHIRLHRLLMNPPNGMVVDHINHNKLDNRRSNLRLCSQQENSFNQSLNSKNMTGYKGVVKCKSSGRYHAFIKKNQKTRFLGSYETKEEAAQVRASAAFSLFGEFTNPNSA